MDVAHVDHPERDHGEGIDVHDFDGADERPEHRPHRMESVVKSFQDDGGVWLAELGQIEELFAMASRDEAATIAAMS